MTTWPAPITKSEVSNLVANVLVLSLALRQDLCRMKKTESNSGKFNLSPRRTKIHCLRGHYFVSLFFSNLSDVVTGFSPKSPYGFYWELLLHSMVHKNIISWSCLRGMTGWLIDWFRIMQYSYYIWKLGLLVPAWLAHFYLVDFFTVGAILEESDQPGHHDFHGGINKTCGSRYIIVLVWLQ